MAVLVTDKSWSTYQDKQLKILENLEDSFEDSISVEKDILEGVLGLPDVIYGATNLLASSIDAIWNDRPLPDILSGMSGIMQSQLEATRDLEDAIEENMDDDDPSDEDPFEDLEDSLIDLTEVIRSLNLDKLWDSAVESADTYSSMLNETIKFTGATEKEAQQFRSNMIDIVDELNEDVGSKFNPEKVLETMISISNQTNISNKKTLEAIAAPIMLAQESMDVNIGTMAETFGRLYTRYNFSSDHMEELVDHMRNVSKDSDVSEQKMQEDMDRLTDILVIRTKGDQDLLLKYLEGVTSASGYLQSQYIDSTPYIEDLASALSTDVTKRSSLNVKYGNYAPDILEAADSGDMTKAVQLMLESIASHPNYAAASAGGTRDISEEQYNRIVSSTYGESLKTANEYLAGIDESQTARESVEDHYVSLQEKLVNELLPDISSNLAKIQEFFGIGWSEIALIFSTAANLKSAFSGALSGQGGAGLLGKFATKFGPALGIGAAAAGIALIATEIRDNIEERRENSGEPYQDALKDENPQYGYGWQGTFDESTGETNWEYSAFKSQEEADNYNPTEALNKYMTAEYSEQNWFEKELDIIEGDFRHGYRKGGGGLLGGLYGVLRTINPFDSNVSGLKLDILDVQEYVDDIMESGNSSLYNFYAQKGLLTDYDEIKNFSQNVDKYSKYFNKGMYKSGDAWYYVGSDSIVPDSKAPKEFAVGTNYIPNDQLAYLHEGEAVVPKEYNPAANMNELERLRRDSDEDTRKELSAIQKELSDIRIFLSQWKSSSEVQEVVRAQRTRSAGRERTYGYN